MTSTESFKETADIKTSADDYAERFSGAVGEWFLEVQEEATLRMLDPYPEATVLDVGGGHGQTAQALIEDGYDLTILGSAEICGKRVQPFVREGLCDFKVGDILNLPFEARSFDVVISYRLLPHVTNWKPYLVELTRVARKAIIIDYPELRSFNYLAPYLFRLKKQIEGSTRPFTCFRMSDLLSVLNDESFVHSEHYRQFFLPMVLHRKLDMIKVSTTAEGISRSLGLTGLLGSPVILKVVRAQQ